MVFQFKKWGLMVITTFSIAIILYTKKIHHEQLKFSETLTRQLFRDNSPLKSTYKSSMQLPEASKASKRVFIYTPIGCTFDVQLCGFMAGCKRAYRICDQSIQDIKAKSLCNLTLAGSYTRYSLGNKNHSFFAHMCRNLTAFDYDLFVKVDDDVMYDPDQLITDLSGLDFKDERALMGFLHFSRNEQVVWPTGGIYAFTKQALLALCEDSRALSGLKGMYEDVHVGIALSRIRSGPKVNYYNLDDLINVSHLQYKSSRVFVQFLQYSTC